MKLTASTAAMFLCQYPSSSMWLHMEEYENIKGLVVASDKKTWAKLAKKVAIPKDTRPVDESDKIEKSADLEIHTDYKFGHKSMVAAGLSCCSGSLNDAQSDERKANNFLLITSPVKNFNQLNKKQRISQFPYEGGIVQKDLLLLTVRTYCVEGGFLPSWWNPTFDLSTEFHQFLHDAIRRECSGLTNSWILKPATGTRGVGHKFIHSRNNGTNASATVSVSSVLSGILPESSDSCDIVAQALSTIATAMNDQEDKSLPRLLKEIATQYSISQYTTQKDSVAQLLISNPLLIKKRKFDLRVFVFVRSFIPFEG